VIPSRVLRDPAVAVSAARQRTAKQLRSRSLRSLGRGPVAHRRSPYSFAAQALQSAWHRLRGWSSQGVIGTPRRAVGLDVMGLEPLGCTVATTTCVLRQGTISISGSKRGSMESAMRFASRSSRSSGARIPITARVRSSTPITSRPPAELAKATRVRSAGAGEERSRLNSSVLPSF